MNLDIQKYTKQLVLPKPDSHKGENGRVLVIGGSELFHAASFWSAAAASKTTDMVHFSSPTLENNELMRVRAKEKYWEGIVVPWEEVEHYILEDDAILIGPGMTRGEETKKVVDSLLAKFPDKKWVIDGGALQEVNIQLLKDQMIVTPNEKELGILEKKEGFKINDSRFKNKTLSIKALVLLKGQIDVVINGGERVEITGGNAGMTKGGTGDVLAGIVVGLYAKSPQLASAVVASYVNKMAGDNLEKRVGVFYAAGELISEIGKVLGKLVKNR